MENTLACCAGDPGSTPATLLQSFSNMSADIHEIILATVNKKDNPYNLTKRIFLKTVSCNISSRVKGDGKRPNMINLSNLAIPKIYLEAKLFYIPLGMAA